MKLLCCFGNICCWKKPKKDQQASTINLITAIVNLVIAILLLIEKLTR